MTCCIIVRGKIVERLTSRAAVARLIRSALRHTEYRIAPIYAKDIFIDPFGDAYADSRAIKVPSDTTCLTIEVVSDVAIERANNRIGSPREDGDE